MGYTIGVDVGGTKVLGGAWERKANLYKQKKEELSD